MEVQCAPVSSLTVCTVRAVYFMPPVYKCSELCTNIALQGSNCAASARGAHVKCTLRAPPAPAGHPCAENLQNVSRCLQFFRIEMPTWHIFVHGRVYNAAVVRDSNVRSQPITARVATHALTDGIRRTCLPVNDKCCARAARFIISVLHDHSTIGDDATGAECHFALLFSSGSLSYVHIAQWCESITECALRRSSGVFIPKVRGARASHQYYLEWRCSLWSASM